MDIEQKEYIKNPPLVSVVINCYNGGQFLREAIESIYAQSYKNWEIVFWDNASTDNSATIAQSYDERLKYFYSKNNTCLGEARVNAIEKTTGEYVAFLDCDDLWEKDKLLKQVELFSEEEYGFIYGRTEVINESDKVNNYIPMCDSVLANGNIFSVFARKQIDITFSSVIVDKRKFFECGGFPSHVETATDYTIYLRMSKRYPVGAVQGLCCKYRVHANNLSKSKYVVSALESIEALSEFLPDERAVDGLKYLYVDLALMYFKEKFFLNTIKTLLKYGGWRYFSKRIISFIYRKYILKRV